MHWQVRNPLPKPLVGSSLIEIQDIGLEEAVELPLMEDQERSHAAPLRLSPDPRNRGGI